MRRRSPLFGLSLALLVAISGCPSSPSSPSTPSEPESVASVDVTPASSDILVGETVQLTATPRSASGGTLAGRTVTWSSSNTTVASVVSSGVVTGVAAGQATITATSEGRSSTATVNVSERPVAAVEIDPAGPIDLFTTQSLQLAATTRDDQNNVLTGRTVTWSTDAAGVADVDSSGVVTAAGPGTAEISAEAEGVTGSVSVIVTDPGPVFISQVSPDPLVEGQAATLTGTGFSATPSFNTVTVDGVPATVTQASTTSLEITVPSFPCLPRRGVDVIASVAGETSPAAAATVSPAGQLTMAVGDQVTLTDPADLCLQFDAAPGPERYVIGVQSVSEVVSTLTGVRVTSDAAGAPVSPPLARPALAPAPELTPIDFAEVRERARRQQAEAVFMDRSLAMLESVRRSSPSLPTPAYRSAPAGIPGDVIEGTEVMIRFPDFNGNTCADFIDITVVVRSVGTRVIVTEDRDNPAMGFVTQDFDDMAADYDGTIYSTLVDYFGEPTDMDSNSRIVVVISKEVNELDGPLGFVSGADLFPMTSCPASNEGEYFYQVAPDPTGIHGDPQTLEDSRKRARGLLAHEVTHIIQIGRRQMAGGSFMTSFMGEGGATAAEQFSGFAFEGRSEGQNYGSDVIYPALGADERFYYGYMGDFLSYFGFDFMSGRVAAAPEECSWVGAALVSAGPCFNGGRLVYGITFSVVQHGIDLYGAGVGGTRAVHRALVDHTGTPGFAAIESVLGVSMSDLMATWAPMLYIDDRFGGPALDTFQFLNWNLRSLEQAWGPEAALQPRSRPFGDFTDDFSVRSASTAYFDVSGAGRDATAIRVTDQAGAPLPGTFQVTVVRVE